MFLSAHGCLRSLSKNCGLCIQKCRSRGVLWLKNLNNVSRWTTLSRNETSFSRSLSFPSRGRRETVLGMSWTQRCLDSVPFNQVKSRFAIGKKICRPIQGQTNFRLQSKRSMSEGASSRLKTIAGLFRIISLGHFVLKKKNHSQATWQLSSKQ